MAYPLENRQLGELQADAQTFDVVVIDSWTPLGLSGKAFANLIRQFPQTIFVVIFRQTTQAVSGGNEPAYDSTINIEVENGVAYNRRTVGAGRHLLPSPIGKK
jgi:hypothetical protein